MRGHQAALHGMWMGHTTDLWGAEVTEGSLEPVVRSARREREQEEAGLDAVVRSFH